MGALINPLFLGAVFAGLGVAFGAFGAHALRDRLDAHALSVFEIGVRYQMYHALALVLLAALAPRIGVKVPTIAFSVGIIIFSGSLYALALSGVRWLGAITPLGGVAFLVGWVCLAISAYQTAK